MTQRTQDIFEHNEAAVDMASERAGEFLAGVGKTDLATFSGDEWRNLLKVVILGWDEKSVPF